eukprot:TRINITY_DN75919_c0_g1_i1.p1 TRINITY_DN75919_c0_g1~~TRINITY_DN75919_c0_g1_i1.p1  ORF type:complete len:394 (+),score=70.37 TRINITY_DN75919_c0_g1_i1:97-1278(+)
MQAVRQAKSGASSSFGVIRGLNYTCSIVERIVRLLSGTSDNAKVARLLQQLESLDIDKEVLRQTKVGEKLSTLVSADASVNALLMRLQQRWGTKKDSTDHHVGRPALVQASSTVNRAAGLSASAARSLLIDLKTTSNKRSREDVGDEEVMANGQKPRTSSSFKSSIWKSDGSLAAQMSSKGSESTSEASPPEKNWPVFLKQRFAAATSPEKTACDNKRPKRREAIRQKIFDALSKPTKSQQTTDSAHENTKDPMKLATCIEEALAKMHGTDDNEYIHHARSVLFNLSDPKNDDFRAKIRSGFIDPSELPSMTADQMASDSKRDERAEMRRLAMEEVDADWDAKHAGVKASEGLLTCNECLGTRTSYFQLQTRKGDEPMTTFAVCSDCGARWKC